MPNPGGNRRVPWLAPRLLSQDDRQADQQSSHRSLVRPVSSGLAPFPAEG